MFFKPDPKWIWNSKSSSEEDDVCFSMGSSGASLTGRVLSCEVDDEIDDEVDDDVEPEKPSTPLHWRQTFFGWGGLCNDLKKSYPAGWRANAAGFVGVMLGGVDVRVYRRYGGELVDWDDSTVDVDWAVRPRPGGRNERIATTMGRLPECLAGVFLKVVLGGHELDPASIPDWLRGAVKETVRREHGRVDRLFRGL